jgi:hypothetical protein
VRDIVNGEVDFESAFSESCDRAGDAGKNWKIRRQNGNLELFKVILGSKFKVDGYDWGDRARLDVGGNTWIEYHDK